MLHSTRIVTVNVNSEEGSGESSDKVGRDQLLDSLARVVVVVPQASRAVRVHAGRVGGSVRRRVGKGHGEGIGRVKHLGNNAAVCGLEGGQAGRQVVVVGGDVGAEVLHVLRGLRSHDGGFDECRCVARRSVSKSAAEDIDGRALTWNREQGEVSDAGIVQNLQLRKILVVDGRDGRVDTIPVRIPDVVDADPEDGHGVISSPAYIFLGIRLEPANLGQHVGRAADERAVQRGPVDSVIVGKRQRRVERGGSVANPVEATIRGSSGEGHADGVS